MRTVLKGWVFPKEPPEISEPPARAGAERPQDEGGGASGAASGPPSNHVLARGSAPALDALEVAKSSVSVLDTYASNAENFVCVLRSALSSMEKQISNLEQAVNPSVKVPRRSALCCLRAAAPGQPREKESALPQGRAGCRRDIGRVRGAALRSAIAKQLFQKTGVDPGFQLVRSSCGGADQPAGFPKAAPGAPAGRLRSYSLMRFEILARQSPVHRSSSCVRAHDMTASPELVWECIKANNSFMRKSPGAGNKTMSAERGNLCGLHSFKFSGLANRQVVGLASARNGKKESIVLTTRQKKEAKAASPSSQYLEKGIKKAPKKGAAQLEKAMGAGFYRKDLLDLALAKYAKINTSFKKKKLVVKSRRAA
ncbi:unnamed protein product [Prorocentrum cordatum]|uniref:Ribosomal eL28/Mak16 domain-containing protein n=1 Tax=Prorocentrum cordatum TaxID=2364126 RepID=A0ABN9V539_9DINO|nr:unnamed protein product [Polarella glacialis]